MGTTKSWSWREQAMGWRKSLEPFGSFLSITWTNAGVKKLIFTPNFCQWQSGSGLLFWWKFILDKGWSTNTWLVRGSIEVGIIYWRRRIFSGFYVVIFLGIKMETLSWLRLDCLANFVHNLVWMTIKWCQRRIQMRKYC